MKSDYCIYPPQPAADLELAEQQDSARVVWMAGAASVGRYLLLGATEYNVLALLDGARTPQQICERFSRAHNGKLSLGTLTKFLTKLDSYGVLAGQRETVTVAPSSLQSQKHYFSIKLFNPDPLFARLLPTLRWVWTTGFFVFSLLFMVGTALLALLSVDDVVAQGSQMIRDHYVAILAAAYVIGVTHEFAHGMTCKAFGGRATEVGVLVIYYFLFGLYCNVSGIHLIPTRGRRLWVIAAGVYWQLLLGAFFFLLWRVFAPDTLLADVIFICLLGSVLDVFLNANPLIKLDGYYFLSQWLRMPNLMDRSRAYWRGLLKQFLFGQTNAEAARYERRERLIYFVYGMLSFAYNVIFAALILNYVSGWLADQFYLLGLFFAAAVALFFLRRPIKQTFGLIKLFVVKQKESKMRDDQQTTTQPEMTVTRPVWRRRVAPLSVAGLVLLFLLMPWRASVGNYGQLIALSERETIIRAPEAATLVQLNVKPGDQLAAGATIGQLANLDIEEQLAELQTDLARANADYNRLLGETRVRGAAAVRTTVALQQRQHDFAEIDAEQRQIRAGLLALPSEARTLANTSRLFKISTAETEPPAAYPAALAALQADAEAQRALFDEAILQRNRLRPLYAQGLVPRSELDAQEARAATLSGSFEAARRRLDAAVIEHRRNHTTTATNLRLAETDAGTERIAIEALSGELRGLRELIASLEARRDLLLRKRGQFELATPRAGWVFGEELSRRTGQFFQKGAEICRVADTRQLLVRIQVPEREIGDVRVGVGVRLKARALPDRTFYGQVSKIGGESEADQTGQTIYRVELTIENEDGALRPGMTAFARIDFDRQLLARVILHKVKQALRPELWLL